MPSRRRSDWATSSGLRTGIMTLDAIPRSSRPFRQNETNRQIRGSFTKRSCASSNSSPIREGSSSANARDVTEAIQAGLNRPQSFHVLPADARTRSLNLPILSDSQYPRSFQPSPAISVFGAETPRRARTPLSADVPLRCMPRMRMACLCACPRSSCVEPIRPSSLRIRRPRASPIAPLIPRSPVGRGKARKSSLRAPARPPADPRR